MSEDDPHYKILELRTELLSDITVFNIRDTAGHGQLCSPIGVEKNVFRILAPQLRA